MGYSIVACLLYLSLGCADDSASEVDYMPFADVIKWADTSGLPEGTSFACQRLSTHTGQCIVTLPEPRKGPLSAQFPDDILYLECSRSKGCGPRQERKS
jgi:hypothetical protein